MKRTLICAALSLSLAALPVAADAHGYYGHGGYYRGGHGGGLVRALALPLIAGAAVLGAVATIATAPLYAAAPAPAYYGPQPVYGYAPPPVYAPAPVPYGYAPPPAYGYAPRVCTYYPNGAEVCR